MSKKGPKNLRALIVSVDRSDAYWQVSQSIYIDRRRRLEIDSVS